MELPAHWLPRPTLALDEATQERLEALYAHAVAPGRGDWIRKKPPVPAWQLLCWLADHKGHLLHGTGDPRIACFEPRQSHDVGEFGNRWAVYAASDGIWAMFFAVIDRVNYPMSISNAAIRLELPSGQTTEPYYFFSMTDHVLSRRPWHEGVVYVLLRDGFEEEGPIERGMIRVHPHHWANPRPVRLLARLRVQPGDFPSLHKIRPRNDAVLFERAKADPNGFPWMD